MCARIRDKWRAGSGGGGGEWREDSALGNSEKCRQQPPCFFFLPTIRKFNILYCREESLQIVTAEKLFQKVKTERKAREITSAKRIPTAFLNAIDWNKLFQRAPPSPKHLICLLIKALRSSMRLLLATGEHSGRKDQKTLPLDICQASLPTKKIFSITEQF